MGFLDFFKKKKVEEEKIEIQEISFHEVKSWIDKKSEDIKDQEKEIFSIIKTKIEDFSKELDLRLKVLEKIDINAKKEAGRTKMIVKQSLDNYIKYAYIFKKEIREVENTNIEEFIGDINKVFSSFEKNSFLFYQRANYLVGDELAEVKKEISNLSTKFKEIFEENKKIINDLRIIKNINSKLKELNAKDSDTKRLNLELVSLDKEIEDLNKNKTDINKEIERVNSSSERLKSNEAKENVKIKESELMTATLGLKALIDFKKLSNVHHSSIKDMNIIKDFKENFQKELIKDDGENLLRLLVEARLSIEEIKARIESIRNIKEEISENESHIIKDVTIDLNNEIKNINYKIESINIQKNKHGQKISTIKEDKINITKFLKEEIKELGVIIN